MRPVLDALAQHVDHAALGDLALEAREELPPRRAVVRRDRALRRRPPAALPRRKARSCAQVDARSRGRSPRAAADVASCRRQDAAPRSATTSRPGRSDVAAPGHVPADQRSRPFSLVSVVMPRPPRRHASMSSVGSHPRRCRRRSSSGSGSSTSSGSRAAASRTSSLPVTTSAIRRVRYSRRRSISRCASVRLRQSHSSLRSRLAESASCSCNGGSEN